MKDPSTRSLASRGGASGSGSGSGSPSDSTGSRSISPLSPAVAGFTVARGRIVEIDLLADPVRLRELDLTVLG